MSGPADVVRPGTGGSGDGADRVTYGVSVSDAAYVAAAAAEEKLGRDTVLLAMGDLLGVVDAFVVTSGRNVRQVRTLVEEIERRVKESTARSPYAIEGLSDGTWVLMDYGDFLVHVFLDETRDFYDLEHLWSRAPRLTWEATPVG